MKKLLKIVVAIIIVLGVAYAGIHFYFDSAEDASVSQGNEPAQAEASVNADSIGNDLAFLLKANDGAQFSAQIIRTIEDAQDSIKAGKTDAGMEYLQNAKTFVNDHLDEIKDMNGVDNGLVEWFVSAPAEELLQDI